MMIGNTLCRFVVGWIVEEAPGCPIPYDHILHIFAQPITKNYFYINMTDDLDAFFEEVEEVANVENEGDSKKISPTEGSTNDNDDMAPPPAKKAKRVVVAAAAAAEPAKAVSPPPRYPAPSRMMMMPAPPPPPPPPPPLPKTKHDPDTPKYTLFVGNLDPMVSDADLEQHFSKYDSLVEATVVRNTKTNASKEFGFVHFFNALDAGQAIRTLHQSWLGSRPIKLQRYNNKKKNETKRKKK